MPTLDYVNQTPAGVTVTYKDVPANTNVVFVNEISGAKTPAQSALSGSGSTDLPIQGLSPGQYYLLAQNSGGPIAQTVMFYVN